MPLTRRQFLWSAAASAALWQGRGRAQEPAPPGSAVFGHGVASGDPLADRVMLWTRVTPPPGTRENATLDVQWRIATDSRMTQVVSRGTARTGAARDFTVKVDARGLSAGREYFYAFERGGERSTIGRTRTAPAAADRLRLGVVSCSNYPAGHFNVYRCLANRADLDAVIHLGDYIYEFDNGIYGDGTSMMRIPEPRRETVTLSDYRIRYATYRADPDLQAAHAQHPFILVWDDHELANDAWLDGAANHNPDKGEGDWPTRRAAAYRAYLEWMPIRESSDTNVLLYRSFRFGGLLDLVMLDTRGLRDQQVPGGDIAGLARPGRTLLGAAQEEWLFEQLRASQRRGASWRVLGQQIVFSRMSPPGASVLLPDTWDGYQAARDRVMDFLAAERVPDVAMLSGDIHSSWGFEVMRNPWGGKTAGATTPLGVEIVTPAISSQPFFTEAAFRERAPVLRALMPHLKFLEGTSNGYVLLDVTRDRLQSDWYFVPTVKERLASEQRGGSLVCERGSSRLVPA